MFPWKRYPWLGVMLVKVNCSEQGQLLTPNEVALQSLSSITIIAIILIPKMQSKQISRYIFLKSTLDTPAI